jgi:hypothetical protein
MPTIAQVGAEISEAPFGDLLYAIAQGIADGQRRMDLSSVQTLIDLAKTNVSIIPEVAEVITPEPFQVNVSGQPPVQVTGARVSASASEPVLMSALQAGILPTFYQFSQADIAIKLSLQIRETEQTETDGTRSVGFLMFASHVNFRTQNTFSYGADASSSVTATIKPVPPPPRLMPATVMVNALGPRPIVNVTP